MNTDPLHNRYRLQAIIGSGGMGTVYKALDQHSQTIVAIKTLKADKLTPETLERFMREGELLYELNHPNIVRHVDAFEHDGQYYLVMEYVAGLSLLSHIQGGTLTLSRILEIGLDISDALTRTHRLGIIHRDIKPANILIGDDGAVKLTDFGIADRRSIDTPTDTVAGTLAYVSPEALQSAPPSPSMDIWALGVVLFEMVAGHHPFRGDNVLAAILYDAAPDLRTLKPDTPPDLALLVRRMLEKDPLSRLPSVRMVGAELERLLEQPTGEVLVVGMVVGDEPTQALHARRVSGQVPYGALELPLQGRRTELTALTALLQQERVVMLTGLGGVGKTRLALELAYTAAPFRDGAIWHTLSPHSRPDDLIELVRRHLDLPAQTKPDAVWDALGSRAVLLVLDNAEAVPDPAAYAPYLDTLDGNGGSRVLLTSRHRWREIRGAREYALDTPDSRTAHAILNAMIERYRPRFTPAEQSMALVEAARQHPRLLEYAVGWLDHYPPDHVREALQTLEGADAQEALDDLLHKTLRQIGALPDGETALAALRRLTVFRGGFSYGAARAILPSIHPLRLLTEWQLVRVEVDGRYSVPPLVVDGVGVDVAAQRLHFDFYHDLATAHDASQDYAALDIESDNLEAAFAWALAQEPPLALQLAATSFGFMYNRGRYRQNLDRFERLLAVLTAPLDRATCQRYLVMAYRDLAQIETPLAHLQQALAMGAAALDTYLRLEDAHGFAQTHINLGVAYEGLALLEDRAANLHRAIESHLTALPHLDTVTAPRAYADAHNSLGNAYHRLSSNEDRVANLERALAAYAEALRYTDPQQTPLTYATLHNNLAGAYWQLARSEDPPRNLQHAIDAYSEALRYRTPTRAPMEHAQTQNNLGMTYGTLADHQDPAQNLRRALAAYQEALRYRTPERNPHLHGVTMSNMGLIYLRLSDHEASLLHLTDAIECLHTALQYLSPANSPQSYATAQHYLGDAYRLLAQVTAQEANLQLSLAAFTIALMYATPAVAPMTYAETQYKRGLTLLALGDHAEACHAWATAAEQYLAIGMEAKAAEMQALIEQHATQE